jgi:GT2 family glycosyltransferase
MDISFGIFTYIGREKEVLNVIESIQNQKIENYEIIVIGGSDKYYDYDTNLLHFQFDESIKENWITKKRNIFFENANYDTLVCIHDYLVFGNNWYQGLIKFGSNFDVLSNKIIKENGLRHFDWMLCTNNENRFDNLIKQSRQQLLPYDIHNLSKLMYISGAFFILKKYVADEFKFNEELVLKEAEDVEWSLRVRKKYIFSFNQFSEVFIPSVHKNSDTRELVTESLLNDLIEYQNNEIKVIYDFLKYKVFLKTYKKLFS